MSQSTTDSDEWLTNYFLTSTQRENSAKRHRYGNDTLESGESQDFSEVAFNPSLPLTFNVSIPDIKFDEDNDKDKSCNFIKFSMPLGLDL